MLRKREVVSERERERERDYTLQPGNDTGHVVSSEASLDQQQRSLLLFFVVCLCMLLRNCNIY